MKTNNLIGEVDDIIFDTITSVCISELYGIEEMKDSGLQKIVNKIIRKCLECPKYVKHDNSITISLFVEVLFGENIVEKCLYLQRCLKQDIESLTGLKVESINVYVRNVIFEKEKTHDKHAS